MKIKILLMAVVLAGLLFSLSASAQVDCANPKTTTKECLVFPFQTTGFDPITLDLPKFNSELGQLLSVEITASTCGSVRTRVDSEHPNPAIWTVVSQGGLYLIPPVGDEVLYVFGTPTTGVSVPLPTDDPTEPVPPDPDENPDFIGPDSFQFDYGTRENPICRDEAPIILDTAEEIAPFNGSEGQTVPVKIESFSDLDFGGPSNSLGLISVSRVGATVCVRYTYCPIEKFCINGSKIGCDNEPLEGWTITLTKPGGSTDTDVTDINGEYSFCGLLPGNYRVSEETRPDWYPLTPTFYDVEIVNDDVEVSAFKNTEHFCISGYKYNVTNNAEDPLKDWKITLTKPDGSTVTDTTDDNGYYEFCDLANGQYKVSEELKTGWIAKSPASVNVVLYCEDEAVDFRNAKQPNLVCVCPFFIRNELYGASCKELKVVDASKGVISNDPPGSVVLNPESITIDPKYGTIEVNEDGSFVYDPTVATGRLYSGMYVMFKYNANNGLCDSVYPGIAKIQLRC